MHSRRPAIPAATRQRLLEAAARVYGRDGLAGATSRAIAAEAGVNEVTLFRHFQTKDRLLAAVVGKNFGGSPESAQSSPPAPTSNLRADLLALGRHYEKQLTENLPLLRTMIGEIQHHGRNHERQVLRAVFRPVKEALVSRLETARASGELRPEMSADLLADLFGGMVFTGVLRRSFKGIDVAYSRDEYLAAATDLVVRGAATGRRR